MKSVDDLAHDGDPVLSLPEYEKLASKIAKAFGGESIDAARATYDAIGAAERSSIDVMVERLLADARVVFWERVDHALEDFAET